MIRVHCACTRRLTDPVPISLQHYQASYFSNSKYQPLVVVESSRQREYRVSYISEKDDAYGRLRSLQPKYGAQCSAMPSDPNILCRQGWLYPRDELVFLRKLGEGQFGEVMLMTAKTISDSSVLVAVKLLQSERPEDEEAFFDEIKLMRNLHHPNIVSFLGYCDGNSDDLDAPPLMILEYMALGDLLNLLIANKPKPNDPSNLKEEDLCSFAVDIARALKYLSEQNYVHRDVAARNVLVSTNLVAKLADFGMTKSLNEQGFIPPGKHEKLPIRWVAPEAIYYKKFETKSDVWSFGILLWEMVTFGDFPHLDKGLDLVLKLAAKGQLLLEPPSDCPLIFRTVILACQNYNPKTRPSFEELIQHFKQNMLKIK